MLCGFFVLSLFDLKIFLVHRPTSCVKLLEGLSRNQKIREEEKFQCTKICVAGDVRIVGAKLIASYSRLP